MSIELVRPAGWERGDDNEWDVVKEGQPIAKLIKAGSRWGAHITVPDYEGDRHSVGHPTRDLALQAIEYVLRG